MKRPVKTVLVILAAVILAGAVTFLVSEFLVIRASKGHNYENADYIIVLGAKVDPWGPSRALDDRLRAAYDYLQAYPECKAVVSGGQGPDEHVAEGGCMAEWLLAKGVEPVRVLVEDRATDTRENLRFSVRQIEADRGADWREAKIVIVSSEYHLCRARYVGRHLLDYDFGTYPAPTSLAAYKFRYFIREALGMVYTRLFYI